MNNNKEIWTDIQGYEGRYEISSWGRVKSCERYVKSNNGNLRKVKERILRLSKDKYGYLQVVLRNNNGIKKTYLVHRLVAQTYLSNHENLSEVNHRDEDKTNNRVENLEFCTSEYNLHYGTRIQRIKEKHSHPLIQVTLKGEVVNIYPSAGEVQRQLGWWQATISRACRNGGAYKGYLWRYIID